MQSRWGKLEISGKHSGNVELMGETEKETHNKKSNHHCPAHVSSTGSAFPECFFSISPDNIPGIPEYQFSTSRQMEICIAEPAELVSNVNPSGKAGRISIRYTWGQQFNDSTCPLTQTNKFFFFILEQSSQVLLIKEGWGGASITMRKRNCGTTEKAEAMQHQIPTSVWTTISVSWQARKR